MVHDADVGYRVAVGEQGVGEVAGANLAYWKIHQFAAETRRGNEFTTTTSPACLSVVDGSIADA